MLTHRRVSRVHLDRLGDRPRLVGELLQGELQLARVDTLGFLAEQPLAQHVELMAEGGILTLGLRELVAQRGDERASGGEILDVSDHTVVSYASTIREGDRSYDASGQVTRSYHRRRRVCATSTPDSSSARSVLRISTGSGGASAGQANVPCSSRL